MREYISRTMSNPCASSAGTVAFTSVMVSPLRVCDIIFSCNLAQLPVGNGSDQRPGGSSYKSIRMRIEPKGVPKCGCSGFTTPDFSGVRISYAGGAMLLSCSYDCMRVVVGKCRCERVVIEVRGILTKK